MRCQRMDEDGKRCKKKAQALVTMHMDPELYESEPNWGVMAVCCKHGSKTLYKLDNKIDFPVNNKCAIVLEDEQNE